MRSYVFYADQQISCLNKALDQPDKEPQFFYGYILTLT
jgi:hypothetical protein